MILTVKLLGFLLVPTMCTLTAKVTRIKEVFSLELVIMLITSQYPTVRSVISLSVTIVDSGVFNENGNSDF